MRVTVIALIALGLVFLALAAEQALDGRAGGDRAGTVVATGVVESLLNGPHHALVKVAPRYGPAFTFPANTQDGLSAGQRVRVRYAPGEPIATATVVTGDGPADAPDGAWSGALVLLVLGIAALIAAAISPLLVRWFPGLLAFRVRP